MGDRNTGNLKQALRSMWDGGEAANWFSEIAREARPARGPAESSALHYFARSGPTKEAHRRALNRSGGLQRSVAGQGHAQKRRVTLPREGLDQGKQVEAGPNRSPTPRGTHQGRDQGTPRGPIRGAWRGLINRCAAVRMAARNCLRNSTRGTALRPKSASARPGPCTRPRSADALTRREIPPGPSTRRQGRSSPAAAPASGDGPRAPGGRGCSTLTPGRAGWSR
jgi:hypothetical protein